MEKNILSYLFLIALISFSCERKELLNPKTISNDFWGKRNTKKSKGKLLVITLYGQTPSFLVYWARVTTIPFEISIRDKTTVEKVGDSSLFRNKFEHKSTDYKIFEKKGLIKLVDYPKKDESLTDSYLYIFPRKATNKYKMVDAMAYFKYLNEDSVAQEINAAIGIIYDKIAKE